MPSGSHDSNISPSSDFGSLDSFRSDRGLLLGGLDALSGLKSRDIFFPGDAMSLINAVNIIVDAARVRVFDWDRAAALIKATGAQTALAGIDKDWLSSSDSIFDDGRARVDSACQAWTENPNMSPCLELDGKRMPCFKEMWVSDITVADRRAIWPGRSAEILPAPAKRPKP